MEKRFDRYFGNNIARKIYIAGIVLIVIGIIVAYTYWAGYGIPVAALGIVAFFAASPFQISDRDIDEKVNSTAESFLKEHVDGRVIGKETLNGSDFSVFKGFICDNNKTSFKSGGDGRLRTSKYYITAVSVKDKRCVVVTSVFDLLSAEKPSESVITTKGAEKAEIKTEPTEFPKGNIKCTLSVVRNENSETLEFYLPDDALAEQLIAMI